MGKEPYAVTARGIVWLLSTETGQRVLQFPKIFNRGSAELSLWQALEKIEDPRVARVEVALEDGGYVPYVGFSATDTETLHAIGTSSLTFDGRGVASCLEEGGIRSGDIPAATVLTALMGEQMLVCSAIPMANVAGWAPLDHVVAEGGQGADTRKGWQAAGPPPLLTRDLPR